jgi:tRNA(Arg) A34 adenosine deaminase TadA
VSESTDIRMMERALELAARAASAGEVPVGAVV